MTPSDKAKALEDFIAKHQRAFERVADKIEAGLTRAGKDGSLKSYDLATVGENLREIMQDAGYDEAVSDLLGSGYQQVLEDAKKFYKGKISDLKFQGTTLEKLQAVQQLDLDRFARLRDSQVNDLSRIIVQAQFGAVPNGDLISQMVESVGSLRKYAGTWVNTGISGFDRQANNAIAVDSGVERFQYVGPMDRETRDFCKDHIGVIKTMDDWIATENEFGQSAATWGGGYNCRHQLVAVLEK